MNEALVFLFALFKAKNRQLYLVGGAVRDLLLGMTPEDYDLCTDAIPEEMEGWFEKTITLGKRFGTIGVILGDKTYEITTFRKDVAYEDGRHPVSVIFSDDVREDVARRDFTVNGLLMDENGVILDYVGGLKDIKNGVIRCIGAPDTRFLEDKLRKWRCIRLAAEKKMEIEDKTRESIHADPSTDEVSVERIRHELDRIVLAEKVTWGGYLLVKTDVMTDILRRTVPAFRNRQKDFRLVESFEIMADLPVDLSMRLAVLALPMSPIERLEFFSQMHYPKAIIDEVLKYSRHFGVTAKDIVGFKRAVGDMGCPLFKKLLILQEKQALWDANPGRQAVVRDNQAAYQKIVAEAQPLTKRDLAINGDDLLALGYEGPAIAKALNDALTYVYGWPKKNKKEILIHYLEEMTRG